MALSLVWFPASPITVLAQVQSGRIVGVVVDPSGASVPGGSITVTEVETNISHTTTSGSGGEYVVTPLGPGLYQVTIKKDGFKTVVCNRIELRVGQAAQFDVELS